jgi:hypothetical protein
VQFEDPAINFWSGETHAIAEGLTLIRLGAHFRGFQALHWAYGDGVLMTGDMPQVCPDRRYVSFMYSYPNFVPVDGLTVRRIVRTLEHTNMRSTMAPGRSSRCWAIRSKRFDARPNATCAQSATVRRRISQSKKCQHTKDGARKAHPRAGLR